ncbi:MAG: hypothetical protein GY719_28635 [bacterium]|nr:hypothetical protein [bacterium]
MSEFSFATWGDTAQSRAVLVDLFERRSLDLEVQNRTTGELTLRPDSSVSRFDDLFPEAPVVDGVEQTAELLYGIKRSNGGFIGLNLDASNGVPSAIQWYDSTLGKRDSTQLLSRVGMAGELIEDNRVMSMWDWQPVADQFFAYGSLGIAGRLDHFREGFYITQVQTPGNDNVTPMAHMVSDLPGHRHYALHHEFIAVIGDVVYFVEMGTHPSLLYFDTRNDELGRLEGFPGSDKPLPYPPFKSVDGIYKAIEGMNIPVGLYASKGFLYALVRQPEGDGVTSWKAVKLRPNFENGTVETVGEVRLPTQQATRHLYVLVGETTWLALELGPMRPGAMKHNLLAAVTIPQSWIAEPHTSPLGSRRPVRCVSGNRAPDPSRTAP